MARNTFIWLCLLPNFGHHFYHFHPYNVFLSFEIQKNYGFNSNLHFVIDLYYLLIPLLLCFGLSLISFSYVWSFAFQNSNSAYKSFPYINLLSGYGLPVLIQTIFLINSSLKPLFYVTEVLLALTSPFYMFNKGLFILKKIINSNIKM